MAYKDDSIQYYAEPWWVKDKRYTYQNGRLIKAYLPYIHLIPLRLVVAGGDKATGHDVATYEIKPFSVKKDMRRNGLPVAGLPLHPNEIYRVSRAKKRPAVIIFSDGKQIDSSLTRGKPNWQKSPTIIVAPYYGADSDGRRAGFNSEILKRIRRCDYPQFMVDQLPLEGPEESILFFNQMQAIGKHHDAIEMLSYRLSEDALVVLEEWINWYFSSELEEDGLLKYFKESVGTLLEI